MVRGEIVALLAAQNANLRTCEIDAIVGAFFDRITEQLVNGGRVEIRGFGTFSTRGRIAHTGRNPRSGQSVELNAKRVPYFRPGKVLRKIVDQPEG